MNRAKLRLLTCTSLCLGVGFAHAADMPVKALVAKAPIVADPWVGTYVGGNLGYSWGRTDTTTSVAPFVQDPLGFFFTFSFPGAATATSLKVDGLIGGGQIGHNFRIAPHWLAGIEADLQWSGQKGSGLGGFGGNTTNCTSQNCSYTGNTDITAKLGWFGTLRMRAGYELDGLWIYGTGGLAVGRVSVSGTNTLSLFDNVSQSVVGLYSTPFSYSKTQAGWTVGVGIEGIVIGTINWRWKAEFLHIDLGSIGAASFGAVPVVTVNTGRFTDEIVRVGLNYRITSGP
jgi:outer membrane immunogenic protein